MLGSFTQFIRAWALVLAWQWPRRSQHYSSTAPTGISRAGTSRRQQEVRRRQRQRERVRPPPRRLVAKGGYRGTSAKDRRFSNQQLLRRMFRNS